MVIENFDTMTLTTSQKNNGFIKLWFAVGADFFKMF